MPIILIVVATIVGAVTGANPDTNADSSTRPNLWEAQHLFFNARYDAAAEAALELQASDPSDLTACELRASALLFQLKAALGNQADKENAFKQCIGCAALMTAFLSETARGQGLARAKLHSTPGDEDALFFLGKLDLNYVWLQLGPLGRKTGWNEYWEARRSLDAVLKRNPAHVRARVARAWIDYVVDTKMPRGTRWVLGGGNKKRALLAMQAAARAEADFFVHAEAMFAWWDLQVRERNLEGAVAIAREIVRDFPDNPELAKFLEKHDPVSVP
jgi:tetratricopeptide (TPR) repeat protein